MTQAMNLANFANSLDSSGGVPPSAINTTIPVSKGGTGATTLTSAAILRGNGTGAISAASASGTIAANG